MRLDLRIIVHINGVLSLKLYLPDSRYSLFGLYIVYINIFRKMNRGYVSQGMEEATYTTKELKKMYGDLEKPLQN